MSNDKKKDPEKDYWQALLEYYDGTPRIFIPDDRTRYWMEFKNWQQKECIVLVNVPKFNSSTAYRRRKLDEIQEFFQMELPF